MSRAREFLASLGIARAEAQAEPPTDWQAATSICIAAPSEASPRWHVAAVTARTPEGVRTDPGAAAREPVMTLYAYGAGATWTRPGIGPAAAALVSRALARAVAVDVQLIVDHLPHEDRDALADAVDVGDEHAIYPRMIQLDRAGAKSKGLPVPSVRDGLVQLRTGLITAPRTPRIDLPHSDLANHGKPLSKFAPEAQRTLLCIAVAAEHARLGAFARPWMAVTPEGTEAQAWALRAASTTIICATCHRIAANCAAAREQAAAAHCARYGVDAFAVAGPGLGSVARGPRPSPTSAPIAAASSLSHRPSSPCAARTAVRLDACDSAAAATRSAASRACRASVLTDSTPASTRSTRSTIAANSCAAADRSARPAFAASAIASASAVTSSRAPLSSPVTCPCASASSFATRFAASAAFAPATIAGRARSPTSVASAFTASCARTTALWAPAAEVAPVFAAALASPAAAATWGSSSNSSDSSKRSTSAYTASVAL
jgi:hypothetical protein